MAAHSSQGPQLGLPQMIQSRPQFGYVGALLVWLFAYLQYAGFNVFNTVLAGEAVAGPFTSETTLWFWSSRLSQPCVALFGYDLIHGFERYLTYLTIIMLALLTVAALTHLDLPGGAFDLADFHLVPFLGQLGVAAGYQISWAIYVSDYSRYLPPESGRGTFKWTFWGSALGGIWVMFLAHSSPRQQARTSTPSARSKALPTSCSRASDRSRCSSQPSGSSPSRR